MNREQFIKKSLLATGATILPPAAFSTIQPTISTQLFNLNYAPHQGQFKHLAGADFLDQIRFAYDQGFRGIEDNGFSHRSVSEQNAIGELLATLGMEMGVFVLDKGGNSAHSLAAGKQDYIDIFLNGCNEAINLSKRSGGKFTTVVPGDFERHISLDLQTANVIEALRKGVEVLEPHGIVMVLEPLSDTPNLFLRTASQAFMICKAVNSPSCKILFDAYHLQRNEGNLITNIDQCWEEIAYFQVGDNPGRKEPTTGEINYKNVFKFIYDKGYRGLVGMEHGISAAGKDGERRLIKAYREVDNFLV